MPFTFIVLSWHLVNNNGVLNSVVWRNIYPKAEEEEIISFKPRILVSSYKQVSSALLVDEEFMSFQNNRKQFDFLAKHGSSGMTDK